MINFNIPFHPFLTVFLCALGGDARAVSVSVQINSFASLLYNFLKLLVSKIIISHFHKILLNGWWQRSSEQFLDCSLKLPFQITFDWILRLCAFKSKLKIRRIVFRFNEKIWQLLISLASTNSSRVLASHVKWKSTWTIHASPVQPPQSSGDAVGQARIKKIHLNWKRKMNQFHPEN